MSLIIDKLESVKRRSGKIVARCPACAEDGADTSGDHLVIYDGGKFGCCANPGDREHRKRIFDLVGDPKPKDFCIHLPKKVSAKAKKVTFGTFGTLFLNSRAQEKKEDPEKCTRIVILPSQTSQTAKRTPPPEDVCPECWANNCAYPLHSKYPCDHQKKDETPLVVPPPGQRYQRQPNGSMLDWGVIENT